MLSENSRAVSGVPRGPYAPPRARARSIAAALAVAAALAGCEGGIGQQGGPTLPPDPTVDQLCAAAGSTLRVGRTRLRRLTRSQIDNTLRDLLGTMDDPAQAIAPDEKIGPFFSNAIAPITDLLVQQHQEVAGRLAVAAQAQMRSIAPCDLATATGDTCARQFIEDFGLRTHRRPLDAEEAARYLALYTLGRGSSGDVANGFRMVVEAMLQSPFFLYHVDVGATGTPSQAPVRLTSYELASRLSYFLWDSMPDRELFTLAGGDRLQDPTVLGAQVDRMLGDARAGAAIPAFHLQWLGIGDVGEVEKDPALFPAYNDELVRSMRAEVASFSDYVVRKGDGLMSTLLTASFSFPEGPLFDLYGVAQPAGFTPGNRVELEPTERAGLLTQPGFLATHAHRDQTSPVHRGLIVRENLLCQPIPAPPPNVNAAPLPVTAGTTVRERFAAHESNPQCGSCHMMMDPIGLGFENYDPIGAYRTTDQGVDVDPSGEIREAASDVAGPFRGVIELSHKLAGSQQVADCVANQWFRFALGRMEANDDACALQAIHQGFKSSGGNVRELLKSMVLSDAFRNVRSIGGDQ